jgi:hypothetical protein
MPKPLGDEGGDAFEIKGFFFTNPKKDCGGTKVLAVKDFILCISNVVFGSLGDVGLNVGEDVAATAAFPGIFSGKIKV